MHTRRSFLQSSALFALSPTVPLFVSRSVRAATPDKDARVLVVVELHGGNDALNPVVPHADEAYARLRPKLKLDPKRLVKLTDSLGLHPALRPLDKLLQAGQLAVVPGVGYPNPNRSHFRSMAIWHTARFDPEEHTSHGWIGRALDLDARQSLLIGTDASPVALRGRRSSVVALSRPDDLALADATTIKQGTDSAASKDDLIEFVRRQALDAYAASDKLAALARGSDDSSYPMTRLAERLRLTA